MTFRKAPFGETGAWHKLQKSGAFFRLKLRSELHWLRSCGWNNILDLEGSRWFKHCCHERGVRRICWAKTRFGWPGGVQIMVWCDALWVKRLFFDSGSYTLFGSWKLNLHFTWSLWKTVFPRSCPKLFDQISWIEEKIERKQSNHSYCSL